MGSYIQKALEELECDATAMLHEALLNFSEDILEAMDQNEMNEESIREAANITEEQFSNIMDTEYDELDLHSISRVAAVLQIQFKIKVGGSDE